MDVATKNDSSNDKMLSELEWTNLLQEIDSHTGLSQETPMQKLKRKFMAEPLIPLGEQHIRNHTCRDLLLITLF